MKKVLILGAGISGLSAAWFLNKYRPDLKITILEKSNRVGGWIRTQKKGDFLFEEGPRGFLSKGKGQITLQLVSDLNLTKELICADKSAQRRYLYYNQKLQPLNLYYLVKMGLLTSCLREWRLKSRSEGDESIGHFFSRRFHPKIVSLVIDPIVKGIFGGDPYKLSLRSCFPMCDHWEKEYGSVIKGIFYSPKEPCEFYSFKEGMETLPLTLAQKIRAEICLTSPVHNLFFEGKKIIAHTHAKIYEADHLIAAISSKSLSSLLPFCKIPPIDFLSLTSVSLGFSRLSLKQRGFGYLVPSQEKDSILGMTWDSQIFPIQNQQTTLCIMIAGEKTQQEALHIAQSALFRHLCINTPPDVTHINRARGAIAQYPVGYKEMLSNLSLPQITLLGSSYFGPGVNDCIAQAAKIMV